MGQISKSWHQVVVTYRANKLKKAQNKANLDFKSYILPWRSRMVAPQNNRDLNQFVLQLCPQFSDPSLNGSRVIARTSNRLTQTDTHTDTHAYTHTQTHAMTIPEGQNWPPVKTHYALHQQSITRCPNLEVVLGNPSWQRPVILWVTWFDKINDTIHYSR